MKILIACEESQIVCNAFRLRGHEAYSCDIQECSGGFPQWHIKDNVLNYLNDKWDMIIAFPPCNDIAVSGSRWFKEKRKDGRQQKAIDFFMKFVNAKCNKIAIENPIGIMSTIYRKPDQIIQPWQFGHGETKATCLWLKNLPKLIPTNIVNGREQRIWKMSPSKERSKLRSKTYIGIAEAMANQWEIKMNYQQQNTELIKSFLKWPEWKFNLNELSDGVTYSKEEIEQWKKLNLLK